MSAEKNLQNVTTMISVVQLIQAGVAMINTASEAMAAGRTAITPEEAAASIISRDGNLDALRAAIARAEAEGR